MQALPHGVERQDDDGDQDEEGDGLRGRRPHIEGLQTGAIDLVAADGGVEAGPPLVMMNTRSKTLNETTSFSRRTVIRLGSTSGRVMRQKVCHTPAPST